MTNLLPPSKIAVVRNFYTARFVTILATILALCAVFALISLVPAYWALMLEGRVLTPVAAPYDATTIQNDRLAVIEGMSYTTLLGSLLDASTSPSAALSRVLAQRPAGVVVSHVSYAPGTITIGGTAGAGPLNTYRTALTDDSLFSKVSVPVNALIGADQGNFTITVTGNF